MMDLYLRYKRRLYKDNMGKLQIILININNENSLHINVNGK